MMTPSKFLGIAAAIAASLGSASAADLTLPVPAENVKRSVVNYDCDGDPLKVEYINSGENAFAILPMRSDRLVFVNVVSGSGVRYASGPYIWWTKGQQASLSDERQPSSATVLDCHEEKNG
jgi:membrane-bound inhibitor of C-type lysozyme